MTGTFLTNCYDSGQIGMVTPLNDISRAHSPKALLCTCMIILSSDRCFLEKLALLMGLPSSWHGHGLCSSPSPDQAAVAASRILSLTRAAECKLFIKDARCECSRYRATCGARCDDWECANARRCASKIPMNYKDMLRSRLYQPTTTVLCHKLE